ncbi:MAG: fatty acid CoA ligase family protein [Isosphaeraceae bacterium]
MAETENIAAHLREMARQRPHQPAVVVPEGRKRAGKVRYSHLTYRQLDDDSDQIARGMSRMGISPGTRAAVMVRPGLDFFAVVFALFKAGVVPVMIDPGIGLRNLGQCLGEAAPEVFIGIPRALLARKLLGWANGSVRRLILVAPGLRWSPITTLDDVRRIGRSPAAVGQPADPPTLPCDPDAPAAILFTSGSTGPPKGAVYTHSIFQGQVERFRSLYEIKPGEIDLCTFPLFALFAPALGMTSIVPEMDPTRPARVDPSRLFEAVDDFGPTNLFGSPALLRRVGPAGNERGIRLPTLRRVVTAGAPASPRVLEEFARLLGPGTEIFTPYGATEALPVASIGSREILEETRHRTDRGEGVCVGRPFAGIDLKVIRVTDEPIPLWSNDLEVGDGTVGEFIVSGPVVTREYFRRPEATALAKIQDPPRGRFFHRMGDLGYRDGQGRLWFCGRKSHRVELGDATLYTICCERVFDVHPDVARTALVGVPSPGGTRPVLCVEPVRRLSAARREEVRRELMQLGAEFPHTRRIETMLFHPAFPVDIRHNSKIFREKLAIWATRCLR